MITSVTPVLNIVQTFLNEDKLYHAVVDLPDTANFLGSITAVATHSKFKVLEGDFSHFFPLKQISVDHNKS